MYNVNTVSLQNIYAPSATTKKESNAAIDVVFAPSAKEKYAQQSGSSAVTADNLYATLAERAKTSAQELAECDFSDMYVWSTAHQFQLTESQRNTIRKAERSDVLFEGAYTISGFRRQLDIREAEAEKEAGTIHVAIGPGELPQFMDDVMQGLSDGVSLLEILQNKLEEYRKISCTESGYGNDIADLFSVNPANGDVVVSLARARIVDCYDADFLDDDAALELADDLTTFLRYAAFPQEDDDPERVEALFSYIKDKQAYANYDRYIFDNNLDESVDNDAMANMIIANLTAASVLKGEDDEEEEEAIDMLMEAVKEHQETLREEMIDREKSELAMEEMKEILYSIA